MSNTETNWFRRLVEWCRPISQEVGALGSAASALIAALAFVVAVAGIFAVFIQIRSNDQSERERIAQDTYREFLKLAIQEPGFANGEHRCSTACANPKEKYEWFVSYFLHAAEQIEDAFPDDRGWCKALASHFCTHHAHLETTEFKSQYVHHYSKSFKQLIGDSLKQCPHEPDPKIYFKFCDSRTAT